MHNKSADDDEAQADRDPDFFAAEQTGRREEEQAGHGEQRTGEPPPFVLRLIHEKHSEGLGLQADGVARIRDHTRGSPKYSSHSGGPMLPPANSANSSPDRSSCRDQEAVRSQARNKPSEWQPAVGPQTDRFRRDFAKSSRLQLARDLTSRKVMKRETLLCLRLEIAGIRGAALSSYAIGDEPAPADARSEVKPAIVDMQQEPP